MRFPNTGTVFEAEENSGILKFLKKSNLDKPCWVSPWQRDASSRILAHGLPQVPELLVAGCQLKKIFFVCPQAMWVTKLVPRGAFVAGCQLKKIFFVCPQAIWVTKLAPGSQSWCQEALLWLVVS